MNISEKNFNKIWNTFLVFIAIAMIFRKPCTGLIILFAAFNLLFLKKLKFMVLPLSINPTAAAQGAIAVEIKKNRSEEFKNLFCL